MSKAVPESWAIRTLSDLASIDNKSLKNNTDPDYRFRYIDIASVKTAKVDIPTEYVSFGESPSRARKCVRKGDVLMSTVRPNLKGFAYFDVQGDDFVASTGFAVLTANKMSDSNFLYQSILSDNVTRQIESLVAGSNYPAISSANVKSLEVLAPPLPEQQKIATILSSVDDVIEKTRAQIDKLKDLKTGMMQELLTKGIGHTEFKDSPVGRIPVTWEVKTLNDVTLLIKSGLSRRIQHNDIGIPLLISGNIQHGRLDTSELKYWFVDDPQGANTENYILSDGDILICFINSMSQIGKSCIYYDIGRPAIYTTNLFRVVPKKEYSSNYLHIIFSSNRFQNEVQLISKPAVNQASFTKTDFEQLVVPVPPKQERKLITQAIISVDSKIIAADRKLKKLESQKKALMQDLLTGKVRVNLTDKESAVV